jgi:hypothetical protein
MSDRQLRHKPTKISYAPPSSEDDPDDGSDLSTPPASPKKKPPPKKTRITDDHSTALAPPLNHPPVQPEASPKPVFHPMPPKAPTHAAYNTLPSEFKGLHGIEPVDILNLFLTKSSFLTMYRIDSVQNTIYVHTFSLVVSSHPLRLPHPLSYK